MCSGRGYQNVEVADPQPKRYRRLRPPAPDAVNQPERERVSCPPCGGLGWEGIDPLLPTIAPPSTAEKQVVVQVRYAAGFPMWLAGDATPEQYNPEMQRELNYAWTALRGSFQGYKTPSIDPLMGDLDEDDDL